MNEPRLYFVQYKLQLSPVWSDDEQTFTSYAEALERIQELYNSSADYLGRSFLSFRINHTA